ncbi:aldolase/citrate lyase family protein [Mesorhizobium sp. M0800]|uniref:aldolase/citrate lyase family protein n=1 Tax=Mesorhizobium sp. M0800 TaxID=2957000 RepID=UPI003336FED4
MNAVPHWRSLLFVPAYSANIASAPERGADGIILDLEDAVPEGSKQEARQQLSESVATVRRNGASALVRVNHELCALAADLDASVIPGVNALVLPKVESSDWVREVGGAVNQLEQKRGLAAGQIRFLTQIESPRALQRLPEIASSDPGWQPWPLAQRIFVQLLAVRPNSIFSCS